MSVEGACVFRSDREGLRLDWERSTYRTLKGDSDGLA